DARPTADRALPALLRDDLKARLLVLRELLAVPQAALAGATTAGLTPRNLQSGTASPPEDAPLLLYGPRGMVPQGAPGTGHAEAYRAERRRGSADSAPEEDAVLQLLRYVEGALARTRVQQLTRLPETRAGQENAPASIWVAEIPFQGPRGLETVELRLERDAPARRGELAESSDWRVLLRLDLGETGPLHALVQLRGRRVGATLWAERSGTFRAAREGLEELAAMLREQGVEVEKLECRRGAPPESVIPACGPLLDVRT
ncbi:MAG: flagellar hook-length control protein FliK, partial [Gammaproteobacteria bacterium]